MTTERYLEEWRSADLITAEQHALLLALARKQRFPLFLELNALLYLGVVAIAGGVAWTLREHVAGAADLLRLRPVSRMPGVRCRGRVPRVPVPDTRRRVARLPAGVGSAVLRAR